MFSPVAPVFLSALAQAASNNNSSVTAVALLSPPSLPPPPADCSGVFAHDACFLLSEAGETCEHVCGSISAIDYERTLKYHWRADVVRALTNRYIGRLASTLEDTQSAGAGGVQPIIFADNIGAACGVPPAPSAMYLFLPLASGWGCYSGEQPDEIDGSYRVPCVCQPPPDVDAYGALLSGVHLALAVTRGVALSYLAPNPRSLAPLSLFLTSPSPRYSWPARWWAYSSMAASATPAAAAEQLATMEPGEPAWAA